MRLWQRDYSEIMQPLWAICESKSGMHSSDNNCSDTAEKIAKNTPQVS